MNYLYLLVESRICFQLCVASPQLNFQTDKSWRGFHLPKNSFVQLILKLDDSCWLLIMLSVADRDLQIRRAGRGGGGGHLDPEIRRGQVSKNFYFGPLSLSLV